MMQDLVSRITECNWDSLNPDLQCIWNAKIDVLLPAPPLLNELSSHHLTLEHFDARELADKVGHDAVLGGRILAVANSARFGLRQPMTSIQRAMVHMGFNLVKSIISTYMLESGFANAPQIPDKHMEFVRHWTAGAAVLAFRWGQQADLGDPSTASTLALISRLGTFLLGGADPPPDDGYRNLASEPERLAFELDTWHVTTPVLSGELARRWNIPHPIPELLENLWMPSAKVLPPHPLDPYLQLLILVAGSLELTAGVVFESCEAIEDVEVFLAEVQRQFLLQNLEEHHLLKALNETWHNGRFRREFDSVIV